MLIKCKTRPILAVLLALILSINRYSAKGDYACLSVIPGIINLYSAETYAENEKRYFDKFIKDLEGLQKVSFWSFFSEYFRILHEYSHNRIFIDVSRGKYYMIQFVYDGIINPTIHKGFFGHLTDKKLQQNEMDVIVRGQRCIFVENYKDLKRKELFKLYSAQFSDYLQMSMIRRTLAKMMSFLMMLEDIERVPVPNSFDWSKLKWFFVVMCFGLMFLVQCCCYQKDVNAIFRQNYLVQVHAAQVLQKKKSLEQNMKLKLAQIKDLLHHSKLMLKHQEKLSDTTQQTLLDAFEKINIAVAKPIQSKQFDYKSLFKTIGFFLVAESLRKIQMDDL